jgi:ketosteroid isomerase-like protein
MSRENVELARAGYEAVARGDLDRVAGLLAPDVRWHGGDPSAEGACHNREQALEFMRAAAGRGVIGRLIDVIDAGDQVVVVMQPRGLGGEQAPVRANITTFRNGRVVEMVAYESPEAAMAAAGLAAADTGDATE